MQTLTRIIKQAIHSKQRVALVSDYGLHRYLVRQIGCDHDAIVHVDEERPHNIMAFDFDIVVYDEAPRKEECLAICCRRVMRKEGRVVVPPHTNIDAYQKCLAERMERY